MFEPKYVFYHESARKAVELDSLGCHPQSLGGNPSQNIVRHKSHAAQYGYSDIVI